MEKIAVCWFRRDLRLDDNTALYHALREHGNVLPLFIFDTLILDKLASKADHRVAFILQRLNEIKTELEKHGSSLLIRYGKPVEIFDELLKKYSITAVYTNNDYEPYGRERDAGIAKFLNGKGVIFKVFKDQVIFEKNEICKEDGNPYTVFTPYSKKWLQTYHQNSPSHVPSEKFTDHFFRTLPFENIDFKAIGFVKTEPVIPPLWPDREIIERYHLTRDFPAMNGTSRISVHLRFGTVSVRKLVKMAAETNMTYLNELIWREFYMMILWQFPHVVQEAFKPQYDRIHWINDEGHFKAWCAGRTGYPIVDAGMRQLNQTGYMHNRVRMIVASFLTKHLLIDWRWGEAYFAARLLDFELSSNNGGWQWAAGSGCDAAPYFRIFNPVLQTGKFDPEMRYIRKWVPEFRDVSYTKPIVDHKTARDRVLKVYKAALNQ